MWTLHSGSVPPRAVAARCKPLAAAGIRYEQKVFRALRRTDLTLHIQPWLCKSPQCEGELCRAQLLQPDAVVLLPGTAVVIEVKLNWKFRRDSKLKKLYLPAVSMAFDRPFVRPLMIVSCLRRFEHLPSRTLLDGLKEALSWTPGLHTPLLLLP